jgi:hypothetical protein
LDDFSKGRNRGAIAGFLAGAGQAGAGAGAGGGGGLPPSTPETCVLEGCAASAFDGLADHGDLLNMTDAVDSKVGLLSFWADLTAGDGDTMYFFNCFQDTGEAFVVIRNSSNQWFIRGRQPSPGLPSTVLTLTSNTSTYNAARGMHHVLVSWNLLTTTAHMWINDSEDLAASPTLENFNVNYTGFTTDGWSLGSRASVKDFKTPVNVSELYFAQEFLDISIEANRRKFITAGLKPVDLGPTGALPTGTAPLCYYKKGDPRVDSSGRDNNMILTGDIELVAGPGC